MGLCTACTHLFQKQYTDREYHDHVNTDPCVTLEYAGLGCMSISAFASLHVLHAILFFCRDNFAAQECYQAWLSMMKACRMRGPAGETSLAICGNNTRMALHLIVEGMKTKDKAVTAEAELLLREALLVGPAAHVWASACIWGAAPCL